MDPISLGCFEEVKGWSSFSSGGPELRIAGEDDISGKALRLDYDFKGLGGFVVARRPFSPDLPEAFEIRFKIKVRGPSNILEFKLVDSSNANVWRATWEDIPSSDDWKELIIRERDLRFAWGPLGQGSPRDIEYLELAVVARAGGKGSLMLKDLVLIDRTYRRKTLLEASSILPGSDPYLALDPESPKGWRSNKGYPQWLLLDFGEEREYGGIVIHWERGFEAYAFKVSISSNPHDWMVVFSTENGTGEKTYIYLPGTRSRFVRIDIENGASEEGVGITALRIEPLSFSETIERFFEYVARDQALGLYPRYLSGSQSYWTVTGAGGLAGPALINEEGLLEPPEADFSILPCLSVGEGLVTWADSLISQSVADGDPTCPTVRWAAKQVLMEITSRQEEGARDLTVSYRIINNNHLPITGSLFLQVLPFQVTPPWQRWGAYGGVARIREISSQGASIYINGREAIRALTPYDGFGTSSYRDGGIARHLKSNSIPARTLSRDDSGLCSAALEFRFHLAHKEACTFLILLPSEGREGANRFYVPTSCRPSNIERGRALKAMFLVPRIDAAAADTVRTCAIHILLNSRGPALCPGPRRYSRAWIRDGVVMGIALARLGVTEPLKDFLLWYGSFQAEDGMLPDCADNLEKEWLLEFDAYGQFLNGIAEYYRFSGDCSFVSSIWPKALKTVAYLESLRERRMTEEFRSPGKSAYFGILPESVSHEGYMANPVHSYWDDFWALRGLKDACLLAQAAGREEYCPKIRRLASAFEKDLKASLLKTIMDKNLDYIPGSVELGDFDPSASSAGIVLLPGGEVMPELQTRRTYEIYMEGVRKREDAQWINYSAYEIRIIGAMAILGMREDAIELLRAMLKDRRIAQWNQWPEITWRDLRAPAFLGDLPHTWISAEYINSFRSIFAYEAVDDKALILASGIPWEWMTHGEEVGVEGLPTHYGSLSYRIRMIGGGKISISLWGDITVPEGGIIVRPPLRGTISRVSVKGGPEVIVREGSIVCLRSPADLIIELQEAG
jgi:hypothetical protein